MAAHRRRPRRKPAGPPRLTKGTYRADLAAGDDLGQAAQVIADEARRIARGNGMPETAASISVEVSGTTATVYSDSPAAYPNEVAGVKHPTYGHRPWVLNQHRPFLGPAADAKAGDAMKRFAEKYDRLLAKAGFK
jgi:hypothetical protein